MKTLIIWSAWLTLSLVCPKGNDSETATMSGGHIEVIGDFLTADTGNPNIEIERIELSGPKGYSLDGCNGSRCGYNIMAVVPGTYEVTLIGTGGFVRTEVEIIE